jgi:hypothetical protein
MDDVFSISFPTLVNSVIGGTGIGEACTSNSNYYTSGAQRETCCCGCDKE